MDSRKLPPKDEPIKSDLCCGKSVFFKSSLTEELVMLGCRGGNAADADSIW
jgi:hypothetical protein